jgi:hypothetical protein
MDENSDYDPREFLLFALHHFQINVASAEGPLIRTEGGYAIEVEGQHLFKLLWHGQVVAPFQSVETLCQFIKRGLHE